MSASNVVYSRQHRQELVDKFNSQVRLDHDVPLGHYYDYLQALIEDARRR